MSISTQESLYHIVACKIILLPGRICCHKTSADTKRKTVQKRTQANKRDKKEMTALHSETV